MSAAITLGKTGHLDKLLAMVATFHDEVGISKSDELRRACVAPLLEGVPLGAVYLIGPPRAPIGYTLLTFGWSLEYGGITGTIEELYIRPGVRGRGVASEAIGKISKALGEVGVMLLYLKLHQHPEKPRRLFTRAGFIPCEDETLMMRKF